MAIIPFLILPALMAAIGFTSYRMSQPRQRTAQVMGTVTGLETEKLRGQGRTRTIYGPVVEYQPSSGPVRQLKPKNYNREKPNIGDQMLVLYDPAVPSSALLQGTSLKARRFGIGMLISAALITFLLIVLGVLLEVS